MVPAEESEVAWVSGVADDDVSEDAGAIGEMEKDVRTKALVSTTGSFEAGAVLNLEVKASTGAPAGDESKDSIMTCDDLAVEFPAVVRVGGRAGVPALVVCALAGLDALPGGV